MSTLHITRGLPASPLAPEIAQMPTLPGKSEGIVGWEPLVLQCRDCGATHVGDRYNPAAEIILSGFHFHGCEGCDGVRRCPDCLAAVTAVCPNRRCSDG